MVPTFINAAVREGLSGAWAEKDKALMDHVAGLLRGLEGKTFSAGLGLGFRLPENLFACFVELPLCLLPCYVGGLVAAATYWYGVRSRRGPVRVAARLVLALLALCVLALPFLAQFLASGSVGPFSAGLFCWILAWKIIDLETRTCDDAVLSSFFALAAHLVIPVEYKTQQVKAEDGSERSLPVPASVSNARRIVLAQLWRFLALLVVLAYLRHTPNTSPVVPFGSMPTLRPWISPRTYAEVWLVYLCLSTSMDTFSIMQTLLGFEPITVFRSPLVFSSSPLDFWGRRWNRLIHGLFKRTVFKPLVQASVPKVLASLMAFFVSGLFHEYSLLFTNARLTGVQLWFFLSQVPLVTMDALLRRRFSGNGEKAASPRTFKSTIFSVACFVVTNAAILPFAPLFIEPLRHSGVLDDATLMYPSIILPGTTFNATGQC